MTWNNQIRPAVFLDRDGVLCKEKSYITDVKDLEIFSYTKNCIDQIHALGYLAICITNQSAVARGLMEETTLQEMHQHLQDMTGLDAVYYCPHHPEGTGSYRLRCSCRKPAIGLIEQARKDYEIDMNHSYMVGDRASDILCGQNAGLKTVLLESGYGSHRLEQPVVPDINVRDLRDFVDIVLLEQ